MRGAASRLPRTHQLQHPAAHGAGEGVPFQPVPVAGPPPRGGPLAAPPRRPGEGLVPEPPHEAEEAGAGGAGRPRRRARGCPGRPRVRPRRPPRKGSAGAVGARLEAAAGGAPRVSLHAGPRRRSPADVSCCDPLPALLIRMQGKVPARNAAGCSVPGRAEAAGWRSWGLTGTAAPRGQSRERLRQLPGIRGAVGVRRGRLKLPTPSSFCV